MNGEEDAVASTAIKVLQSSIELILDRDKKKKLRFNAILDVIFKQINGYISPTSSSNFSAPTPSDSLQPSASSSLKYLWYAHLPSRVAPLNDSVKRSLENTWKDCVRKESGMIFQIIHDSLNKICSGFLAKITNSN